MTMTHARPVLTSNTSRAECAGRRDGYYSNGCTSDFVYCHGGVATAMKCPASLVFNEERGLCDYMENCTEKSAPVVVPIPTQPAPTIPPQQQAQASSGTLDCAGRPNGHYSKGCSNDFVICNDGVATAMKCPPMLVFNEKNGYCDYPESCQAGGAAVHKPPTTQRSPPPSSSDLPCYNREDGYYSDGCSSEFVYCFQGEATYFQCPAGLVYDEKAGYCDYSENCGGRSEADSVLKPSQESIVALTSSADEHSCKGRPDGYYSNGCTPEFIHCRDGVTTRMKCPSSLVFNQEMNYCDYPEVCSPQEEQTPSAAAPPSKPQISFVCPESTGVFSLGCTSEFVVCSHDVAQVMTCPEGLVFNFAKGNCDHKEKCHEGKKSKPAADTPPAAHAEPSTSRISSECKNLPDGTFGSHCGSSFVVCASGVAYTMNCPSDLVFDAKAKRCVYSKDCDKKSAGKKHDKGTTALHSPQTTRNGYFFIYECDVDVKLRLDCIGKPDGLHSLGCVGEFLQCVGGRTYSLHCPAGLVFVERLGVCDEPSTCKQLHRPKNVSGPLAYEPLVSSTPEDTECEAEGYFAHFCSVEFYNCVHGKLFVGKCPDGLVFNPDKSACEHVESCAGIKESKQRSSITLAAPKTEFSKDNSCKDRPDGVISDLDCQPHFTTCLAGIAFVTKCPAGLVYSVKAKLCDYPDVCGKEHHSSAAPAAEPTRAVSAQYQDTAVGKDLCAGKASGPLEHSNCRSSFSFCVHGALYTMNCAPGLLFSFESHRYTNFLFSEEAL
ncbi:unnamed protein product [Cylicostephanus goldi]|uniref:Chitin-binding type-2 domain-containing protein n=1 Tax=Cylicostephanus goldi TaxID=71465 RepID=A0A3P6QUV1_CYLGO|nr:unnamed protein product [Cylicostephanus goldi]